jgi:hypothetical protein
MDKYLTSRLYEQHFLRKAWAFLLLYYLSALKMSLSSVKQGYGVEHCHPTGDRFGKA